MVAPGMAFYGATKSAKTTKAQMVAFVDAFNAQLSDDFCPVWGKLQIEAKFYDDPKTIPDGMPAIALMDRSDVRGALAYHTENANGTITGVVGILTCEEDGESWESGASHEGLETACNPYVNGWITMPGNGGRRKIAKEVCDPVQDGVYKKNGVEMSNFVTPEYFDEDAPAGSKFDFIGALSEPFTKTDGGYYEYDDAGVVKQLGNKPRHRAHVRQSDREEHEQRLRGT